ncbi:hypothetical protein QBC46DRAFT_372294 [Diplogelasinospora grovesii]|uniref:Thioredoxin-like fold domain-containing protein n=1 Tax=Diplogelasinospora grovesii TaxID=303347 RepID=A0AAN6NGR0_9PEZI|nr:hypothetical protein QBC46DRAFT_372294 [Diplogelasinospora grovesii]
MALPPQFHNLRFSGDRLPPMHTVELYLDYVCPFSAKMFKTIVVDLLPALRQESPDLLDDVQFIFRPQVQPWHPSSTLCHEAALAVLRLGTHAQFWGVSRALFERQNEFFDVSVVNETRNQTYRRLCDLAAAATQGIDAEQMYRLLEIPENPAEDGSLNAGNAVTNDLKVVVKMARLVGVHVSPTVIFDGIVANEISSSWTVGDWVDYLVKKTH